MTAHNKKLKQITFDLGGTEFQGQCTTWNMNNNTPDGELRFVYDEGEEFREEVDPDWSLTMTFYSDWRSGGISDYLQQQDEETVSFQLDHHPGVTGEHTRWVGSVKIKAPTVGGDVRTTEQTSVTLQCVGKPTYSRVA
jgi:hypothetical protein